MNHWLKLSIARKIAQKLQKKYCGLPKDDDLEVKIINELWSDPEYRQDMWLNINCDTLGNILWVQIGTDRGIVP